MTNRYPDSDALRDEKDAIAPLMRYGKDEMNLAEFPFAILRRQSDKRTSFSYEGYVTGPGGTRHKQKWTVHGLSGVGLPNEYDERVLIALMAVSAAEGFSNRRVPFSVYRLLRIMGLTDSARDYRNIESSLDRLVGVTIFAEGSFWDNKAKSFLKQKSGFHILERYWLAYKEEDQNVVESEGVQAYFVWSEDLWQSIQDGYIKNLDLNFYYSLETPLARRLYRFLGKRLYRKNYFEIDIFELAGRLGMAVYKYPSQVLEKLQPAVDELIRKHFLAQAGSKKVKEYTRFWVEKYGTNGANTLEDSENPSSEEFEDLPAIVLDMMEYGLSQSLAEAFAARFEEPYIQSKLDYLQRQLRRNRRSIRNPSGWLRKAIEEDFVPPTTPIDQLLLEENVGIPTEQVSGMTAGSNVTLEPQSSGFLRSTWRRVLEEMKLGVTRQTFDHLFARTQLLHLDPRSAVIEVPDPRVFEWIQERFTTPLQRAIELVTGQTGIQMRFVVGEDGPTES